MTSDAASSQPRKRAWKRLIVALACVVAVIAIVLLATPQKQEPVKVWFARATNEAGVKKLVFEGTNGLSGEIVFQAFLFTGGMDERKIPAGGRVCYNADEIRVLARTNLSFTLKAPPEKVPYYVRWTIVELGHAPTRRERFRSGCYEFVYTHGMPRLAQLFLQKVEAHYIPSSEIKE